MSKPETVQDRLFRQAAAAGHQVSRRGDGFVIVVHFRRSGGDTYPLQWAVQAAEGEPVMVRKLLDYEGWRRAAEPTVAAVLAAIEAAEMADSRAGWPDMPQYHVVSLAEVVA